MNGHEHTWFECFRQADPPARVLDCGCGARRKIFPGSGSAQPEIEDVAPAPGGSVANCLVYMRGAERSSGLGDPQADLRMNLLTATPHMET